MTDLCARPTCDRKAYSHGYCEQHAQALGLRSPYRPVSELHEAVHCLERHGWTQPKSAKPQELAGATFTASCMCRSTSG